MRNAILKKRFLQPGETEREMYRRVAKAIVPEGFAYYESAMADGKFLPNSPTLANAGTDRVGGFSACYVIPIEDSLEGIYRAVWHSACVHKYFGGTGFDFTPLRPRGSNIRSTGGSACGPVKVLQLLNQSAETVSQGGKREGANMGILSMGHPDINEFISAKSGQGSLTHFNLSVSIEDELVGRDDQIFARMASRAHASGCPGAIFIDRINDANPTPNLGRILATNPCGEQPLLPYESCNLGSINLSAYTYEDSFHREEFRDMVYGAVVFLNRVIDENRFPLKEIEEATLRTRKIGLGIMGWHDCLIKLGIPYCSDRAINFIDEIGEELQSASREASRALAEENGTFPTWEGSIWHKQGIRLHNATLTTIAPTGTLHYLAGCSSGIEPVYSWKHYRTSEEGRDVIIHPLYDLVKGTDLEDETALKIPWIWHLKHQAQWQKWIDNAVSKTINLPNDATVGTVEEIFETAYKMGVKGVTIYRDGSKDVQVLSTISVRNSATASRERSGITYERRSGCGTIYTTANTNLEEPYEVFVRTAGGCEANSEAIGRLISGWLQDGGDPSRIAHILHKVKCHNAMRREGSDGKSCADIIGACMDMAYGKERKTLVVHKTCPDCGTVLEFTEGCGTGTCPGCGWSGCS